MDDTARIARSRSGANAPYASMAKDPGNVQDRRMTRYADQFYKTDGLRVPNNSRVGLDHKLGQKQHDGIWYGNTYGDGGGQAGALRTGANFVERRPTSPFLAVISQPGRQYTDGLAEQRWSGPNSIGSPGPAALPPPPAVTDPGLHKSVGRAWTGDPASLLIPSDGAVAFEDRYGAPPLPPDQDLIATARAMTTGDPSQASLPRRPRNSGPAPDTRRGKPIR